MAAGRKTGGRKPGSKNKMSVDVRQAILDAYTEIGGAKTLAEWARENKTEYFKIFAKLLPKEIDVSGSVRLEDIVGGADNPNDE